MDQDVLKQAAAFVAAVRTYPLFGRRVPAAIIPVKMTLRVVALDEAMARNDAWGELLDAADAACRSGLIDRGWVAEADVEGHIVAVREPVSQIIREDWRSARGSTCPAWVEGSALAMLLGASRELLGVSRERLVGKRFRSDFFRRVLPVLDAGWLPSGIEGEEGKATLFVT